MKKVRLGIIGMGNMGTAHAKSLQDGKVPGCELAGVFDVDKASLARFPDIKSYGDTGEMFRSGDVDAVLVATPHYSHTTIGIEALENGIHLLVEKPISVHKADCERLIAAHEKNPNLVFAAMFNQRTEPYYKKVRELVKNGELGRIWRINWIITTWFRTETYYASGGWRATWKGEGGGVLLNQCPHQLDLFQWIFGMPAKVRSFCGFRKFHDIEVEDDVTAYMEYADGATAIFITNTGEAPGTNRLEVVGEQGRLVVEDQQLNFLRNEVPMSEFSRTSDQAFARPDVWEVSIPVKGTAGKHVEILRNFTDAILHGKELIAPAAEGIHSVELANAMLYSAFRDATVELPLDGAAYEEALNQKIQGSTHQKKVVRKSDEDFTKSFDA